jgi:lipopolysaccharide/colanic/teichoic acid biosynthesis glycosyltransferase
MRRISDSLSLNTAPREPRQRQISKHRQQPFAATDLMIRLGDVVIASAALVFTLPLLLIVALVILSEGAGPVLYRQACIGRLGHRFQMLRFRNGLDETAPYPWKVTGAGWFLWYTRVQNLPALINVIRGEMGIIDTRLPSFLLE